MRFKHKKIYKALGFGVFTIAIVFLILQSSLFSAPFHDVHVNTSEAFYQTVLEENLEIWGLGTHLHEYVTNDRPYSWYIDQANTGTHSSNNCGPASIAMAAKWYNENSRCTPQRARLHYRPFGGWWYSNDITDSLERFGVKYFLWTLEDEETLMTLIRMGHIVIVNNTMSGIKRNWNEGERTGRFYDFGSGHYLIVKGFVRVDDQVFFEVYDPNSWSMIYDDGLALGQNRYFEAQELVQSILSWYPELVVIPNR